MNPRHRKPYDSILETIGWTPLVRLQQVARGVRTPVFGKAEFMNPGGSVKDRIGPAIIEAAEREGRLRPGGTIVEGTSGNTGIGLALAAAHKGYRCIFTISDKMSQEKVRLLKAFGAEVIVTPAAVPPDHPDNYVETAKRIARETPNAILADQFYNQANPEAHYRTTGPEIWEDTGGRVDVLVAGVGTGGFITGVGSVLKQRNPKLKIIAVEPESSAVLFGRKPGWHEIQGIGAGFIPAVLDRSVIDEVFPVSNEAARDMTRRLAREEGVLSGPSSGANVFAMGEVGKRAGFRGKTLLTLICDTGERYLSTPAYAEE
jgi:cystathionine beta-synthase